MYRFYIFSIIPIFIGLLLFLFNRKVVWQEWLGGTAIALLTSLIFTTIAFMGMTQDVETWSGQITKAIFYPRWVEEYTETHTRTVGSGDNEHTETYTDTHHRTHDEHWNLESTLNQDVKVERPLYLEVVKNFGGKIETKNGNKDGFDSGDPNIYVTINKTGFVYPVTDTRSFENRIKAAPTVFSFAQVPKGVPVYEYPPNDNWLKSDRLLGNIPIDSMEFDRMNAKLGSLKKVNVIMVYFGNKDASIAQWQRAKWIGGKKNDIVICYGGTPNKANWSVVFGWTEKDIVKKNIETIMLTNVVANSILPVIEYEIRKNYEIKDWHKFDYISIEPPSWSYFVFFIIMILSQGGFWLWANANEFDKTKEDKFKKKSSNFCHRYH